MNEQSKLQRQLSYHQKRANVWEHTVNRIIQAYDDSPDISPDIQNKLDTIIQEGSHAFIRIWDEYKSAETNAPPTE